MGLFLRIKNPGVCPIEGFTVFGASLSRDVSASSNSWIIGQFGTGTKHAIALLMRHLNAAYEHDPIVPIIYCGLHGITPYLEAKEIRDSTSSKIVHMVCFQHSGKDQKTGRPTRRKEMTSNSIENGVQDWNYIDMAMREFVSNALDMSFRLECSQHPDAQVRSLSTLAEMLDPVFAWKKVIVDVVSDDKVKADAECTSVFIPMNEAVENFATSIGRWFLQFSDIKAIKTRIVLPKTNRNLPRKDKQNRQAAVVYRKGVRVREFGEDRTAIPKPSLFDYNLNDLRMDESRRVDDWSIKAACGTALGFADGPTIQRFYEALLECQPKWVLDPVDPAHEGTFAEYPTTGHRTQFENKYWEFDLDGHDLCDAASGEGHEDRQQMWQIFAQEILGPNAVLCDALLTGMVQMKGYDPIVCPEGIRIGLRAYHVKTDTDVLSKDDLTARTSTDPHWWWTRLFDGLWTGLDKIGAIGTTEDHAIHGEEYRLKQPTLKGFVVDKDAPEGVKAQSKNIHAYYTKGEKGSGTVYLSSEFFAEDMADTLWPQAQKAMLEQLAMHITGKKNNDMSYWNWFVDLTLAVIRQGQKPRLEKPRLGVSSDELG